jgi:hypothetical protein
VAQERIADVPLEEGLDDGREHHGVGDQEDQTGDDDEDGDAFFMIEIDCICGRYNSPYVNFSPVNDSLLTKRHTCECGRVYSLREDPKSEFQILVKLK